MLIIWMCLLSKEFIEVKSGLFQHLLSLLVSGRFIQCVSWFNGCSYIQLLVESSSACLSEFEEQYGFIGGKDM